MKKASSSILELVQKKEIPGQAGDDNAVYLILFQ